MGWGENLATLRGMLDVPEAMANAVVLAALRHRWDGVVVSRISGNDLHFTVPGDEHPFSRQVQVRPAGAGFAATLDVDGESVREHLVSHADIDAVADDLLARLMGDVRICRRCGRPVETSADQFDVFEHMHYVCFHYDFEHDPADPDDECSAGGCPSANLDSPPKIR